MREMTTDERQAIRPASAAQSAARILLPILFIWYLLDFPGGTARDDAVTLGEAFGDHAPRAHYGSLAQRYAGQDHAVHADQRMLLGGDS